MADFKALAARSSRFDNNEAVQAAFCIGTNATVYATGSVSASTDPFTSKTNKYAETTTVIVFCTAVAHVKWSAAGTAAVAATDYPIPANTPVPFTVDRDAQFLRVIPDSGSASFWVTEVA